MAERDGEAVAASRRERKKRRTRQEIYGAAMKLFAESGYNGVTVEAICDSADVARATFFAHFPTKAALLFEFARSIDERCEAAAPGPTASASEELERFWEQIAEAWFEQGEVMIAMLREFIQMPGTGMLPDGEPTPLHARAAAIIARGQRSGEFRSGLASEVLAHAFLLTAAAIMLGNAMRSDASPPEELVRQFVAHLFHGLVVKGP